LAGNFASSKLSKYFSGIPVSTFCSAYLFSQLLSSGYETFGPCMAFLSNSLTFAVQPSIKLFVVQIKVGTVVNVSVIIYGDFGHFLAILTIFRQLWSFSEILAIFGDLGHFLAV
jgi:hypothetical protein